MALVLIIGAGKGLGLELVKIHLKNNDTVWSVSQNVDQLDALSTNNESLKIIKLDFAKTENHSLILDSFDIVTFPQIIYYNAATLINKDFGKLSKIEIYKMIQLNFLSYVFFTQIIINRYKQGIHFVAISSMGGFQGSAKFAGLSFYSASKAALGSLFESLSVEYSKHSFNTLALGAVNTEMLRHAFPGYTAPINADKMAEFIYWFGKNGAQFFQGKTIPVALSTP
jgi:short-subunit dehydrogenase